MSPRPLVAAALAFAFLCPLPVWSAGDAARGEKLHEKCLNCHGTGLYAPDRRKVKSLAALKKELRKWNTYYAPPFTDPQLDDLLAYLNERFYRF